MVKYRVPLNTYIPIHETSGVIQNLSTVGRIKIAKSDSPGSGFIVLGPLEKTTFAGKIYASSIGFNTSLMVHPGDPVWTGDGLPADIFAKDEEVTAMLDNIFGPDE